MEPTKEVKKLTDSVEYLTSLGDHTPRQILERSLTVFSHNLDIKLDRNRTFWANYDSQRGALLEVYPNHIAKVRKAILSGGVVIRYQMLDELRVRTFYVSLDEENDFGPNVKAFEKAINLLVRPSKKSRKLKHVINRESIDKLIKAKPAVYPDRFCHPDPLTLFLGE